MLYPPKGNQHLALMSGISKSHVKTLPANLSRCFTKDIILAALYLLLLPLPLRGFSLQGSLQYDAAFQGAKRQVCVQG